MSRKFRCSKQRLIPWSLTACLLFLLGANTSVFAETVVDDFVEFQADADPTNGGDGRSSFVSEDPNDPMSGIIIGGGRDVNVNAISGANDQNGNDLCEVGDACSRVTITGGELSFSNDATVTGTALVQWDGPDQDIALDNTGLGPIDLTEGGFVDALELTIVFADQDFEFVIEAYSGSDVSDVTIMQSATADPVVLTIPFAYFTGDADFSNLGALQLLLNTTNGRDLVRDLDVTLSEITTPGGPPLACRVTGGGNDTLYTSDGIAYEVWDKKNFEQGSMLNSNGTEEFYTFGGQAGAPTALDPQPSGEWNHTNHRGNFGRFTFHGGTASSKPGTEIQDIRCSDEGGCRPSGNPPSPAKQIDFDGVGTFSNIGSGSHAPDWLDDAAVAVEEPNGRRDGPFTYHWFEVNIDDLGEGPNDAMPGSAECPADGFGEKSTTADANCDCPDFYRITIYNGVAASDVTFLSDGSIDLGDLNMTDVIYEVRGYINGGNLQIHDLTGFDRP